MSQENSQSPQAEVAPVAPAAIPVSQPGPASQSFPVSQSSPAGQPRRAGELIEEILFEGAPSCWGLLGESILAALLTMLLLAIPIVCYSMQWAIPVYLTIACFILAMVPPLRLVALQKSTRYKITNYRIDYERGLLNTRIDSLELWHVDDVAFRQNLLQRMAGVGSIELMSHDKTNPQLTLNSIPGARDLYDKLKNRIIAAKRERGILEVEK